MIHLVVIGRDERVDVSIDEPGQERSPPEVNDPGALWNNPPVTRRLDTVFDDQNNRISSDALPVTINNGPCNKSGLHLRPDPSREEQKGKNARNCLI